MRPRTVATSPEPVTATSAQLIELAWSYQQRPGVGAGIAARHQGVSPETIARAWTAQFPPESPLPRPGRPEERPQRRRCRRRPRTRRLIVGRNEQQLTDPFDGRRVGTRLLPDLMTRRNTAVDPTLTGCLIRQVRRKPNFRPPDQPKPKGRQTAPSIPHAHLTSRCTPLPVLRCRQRMAARNDGTTAQRKNRCRKRDPLAMPSTAIDPCGDPG